MDFTLVVMPLCDKILLYVSVFFPECGRWAPWESCGTPQSSSGHSEAGGTVHPQSPGGDGITLWENEVGEAPATEQLPPVGFFRVDAPLPCLSSSSLLAICSGLFLNSLPKKSITNIPKFSFSSYSHILYIVLLTFSVAFLIFAIITLDTTTLDKH